MVYFSLLLILSSYSWAQEITFLKPCTDEVMHQSYDRGSGDTLGDLTLTALKQSGFDHIASELGVNSINGTPMGEAALEIVSREEMYAYGWCYSVNGVTPELYPHQITIDEQDRILWWFGHAHYLRGQWLSQCEQAVNRRSSPVCRSLL